MKLLAGYFSVFAALAALSAIAAAQNAPLPSGTPTAPTCLQSRIDSDPAALLIASPLSSAIPKACSILQFVSLHNRIASTDDSYKFDSFEFHVYNPSYAAYKLTDNSGCPAILQSIITSSVLEGQPAGSGFWGGWLVQDNKNWSISNTNYPANGLLLPSPSSTWSYTWAKSNQGAPYKRGTGAAASTGFTSGSGKLIGSGSQPSSSFNGSATGTTNSVVLSMSPLPPLDTGTTISQSPGVSSSANGSATMVPAPGSTGTTVRPPSTTSSSPTTTTTSSASSTSYSSVAAYKLPPSGTSIAPSSPAATDAAVVLGSLLFALAASLATVALADVTADATAVATVDAAIYEVEAFFSDLGGDPTKGSCAGGGTKRSVGKRQLNPFVDLGKLTDITDLAGCADAILKALKANLAQAAPNAALAAVLLADLKQLADKASKAKQNPSQSADSRPSQPSQTSESTSGSSTSSTSSSSSCAICCTQETAATDGGLAAITPAPADWNDIDGSLKRAVPERFQRMEKRASTGKPIVQIKGSRSSCVLGTPGGWQVVCRSRAQRHCSRQFCTMLQKPWALSFVHS